MVEPRTITSLPCQPTEHAKFSGASASHMVAPFFELDHGLAVETALPAFLLGCFNELCSRFVIGTFTVSVPLSIAEDTNFGSTLAAPTIFAPFVHVDVAWFDPFATAASRTVDAIFSHILFVFLVPENFELGTE